jgi:hypothetical protein
MQVMLNAPFMKNQQVTSRTMVHETIHAFDVCRVHLDYNSCKHIACTEVRAANLSTDCNFMEEVNRGIFKFQGQQKVSELVIPLKAIIVLLLMCFGGKHCFLLTLFCLCSDVCIVEQLSPFLRSPLVLVWYVSPAALFYPHLVFYVASVLLFTIHVSRSQQAADKVVDSVFDACYADTEPFGGIP